MCMLPLLFFFFFLKQETLCYSEHGGFQVFIANELSQFCLLGYDRGTIFFLQPILSLQSD